MIGTGPHVRAYHLGPGDMVLDDEPNCSTAARSCAPRWRSPEVIEVGVEELAPLKPGEVLVRVEAAGLNHAETLIRSGNYAVRLPFPYPLGGEGSGVVTAIGPEEWSPSPWVPGCVGARSSDRARPLSRRQLRCWCLSPTVSASRTPPACSVAGLTAGGLARVWPLKRTQCGGLGGRWRSRSIACGHSCRPGSRRHRDCQWQTGGRRSRCRGQPRHRSDH